MERGQGDSIFLAQCGRSFISCSRVEEGADGGAKIKPKCIR
jgi:hypothetical protein